MNVPATNMLAGVQYSVSVQKKETQSSEEMGQQALKLIEAAAAPKVHAAGDVGTNLDLHA